MAFAQLIGGTSGKEAMRNMTRIIPGPPLALLALLAACGGSTANDTREETFPATSSGTAREESNSATATPAGNDTTPVVRSTPPVATDPQTIPSPFLGRWGLSREDCNPVATDATGLLTITADRLEFYESVGELSNLAHAGSDRMRASFDFTGEGMTWQRDMVFDLRDDGNTLVRNEIGGDAASGPFRYNRCRQGELR